MGDRVAVLSRGELQQVDPPQQLYDNPDNLFVAGFIGSPAMNICEGRLEKDDEGILVRFGSQTLRVTEGTLERYPGVPDAVGQPVAVGMRPEHFVEPDGSLSDDQRFESEVRLVEALGAELLVHFQVDAPPILTEDMREAIDDPDAIANMERRAAEGQTFTARFDPGRAPKVGEHIQIGFRPEYLHFFDMKSGRALR